MRGKKGTLDNSGTARATERSTARPQAFLAQWVILGLALLALGAILAVNLLQGRARSEQMARDRLSLGAQSLAQQVERRLTLIDQALLDLRNNMPELANDHGRDAHLALHLRTLQNAVDGVRTFSVFDAQGNLSASSRPELVGNNFAHRKYFQDVLKTPDANTLYVSEPFVTSLGVFSLQLVRATFTATGEFSGVLTATIDPEAFRTMLASLRYTPDVSAGLIHSAGKVFVYSATPDIAPGTNASDPGTFFSRHMASGETSSLLTGASPSLPNERLAALITVNTPKRSMNASLIVTLSQERASILKPWLVDVRNQGLLFVLLVGLSSLGLFAYQRYQQQHHAINRRHQLSRRHDLDRLQLATEVSKTGVWEFNFTTSTFVGDETMYRLFGREKSDTPPTYDEWKACVVKEDLPAVQAAVRAAVKQRTEVETTYRIHLDDGSLRTMDARARVYYGESGQPTKMIGVARDITERQQAEQALRDSREFTVGILDSLTNHIAVLDPQGKIIAVNQAWRDFAASNGAPSSDSAYAGGNYLTVCEHPSSDGSESSAFAASRGIREVLNGTRADFSLEYPCHAPHEERWFFMRVTRLRGSISGAVVSHVNTTQRKLAERKVVEAMKTTQQFIDHLPGTAYVKDENLRIVMANQAFQTLLGLDPAEMLGKTNRELFPGDFGRKIEEDDQRVIDTGRSTSIEEDYAGRFFESRKFVIEGGNGRRLLGGITMDVTQRQKSFARQEALLQIGKMAGQLPEKEFLGQCLEMVERLSGSSIGFIHFVNADQETIELVTWTPGALKGCTAVHERHYPLGEAGIWADCARTREVSMINDYPAYLAKKGLPEGHAHLQRFISVPVIDEDRVCLILGVGNKTSDYDEFDCATAQLIGNDAWRVTRRIRAEAELKQKLDELIALNQRLDETNNRLLQSEKLASLGQLAAGVAHEINNPIGYVSSNLNTLAGYVKELLTLDALYVDIEKRFATNLPGAFFGTQQLKDEIDHKFLVADIQHLLDESREGLARVRKIVQDLKDFSRIGSKGWERVNLHAGLESTLNIVWNEIKYKAEVDRDYGELPDILCIPSQINQVFLNLLTNAAQSIETRGHIGIRSGCDDKSVWFEISDDGAGISPEHQAHIFDPFFTTKPVGQGTGLGLSLSWGIIQRHHGQIKVDSELGRGTCFRIVLPINQPIEQPTEQPERSGTIVEILADNNTP